MAISLSWHFAAGSVVVPWPAPFLVAVSTRIGRDLD
jgi:hypothetical protein